MSFSVPDRKGAGKAKHSSMLYDKNVEMTLSPLNYIVLLLLIAPVLILGIYFTPLINIAKESVQLLGF